ncbi:hypothetical protein [Pyrococcus abyssi]|nr:hypothetical protein [Pyrococcus abyssi]
MKVEVYEVDEKTFKKINIMEVNAGYKPVEVDTKFGKTILWEWAYEPSGEKMESGDFDDVKFERW